MLFRPMSIIAGLMALTLGSLPVLAQSNTDCNGTLRTDHQTQRRQGLKLKKHLNLVAKE